MVQLNTVREGFPHILLNKHKSYRFWQSVQEIILFRMKSCLKWIFKPVRSGCNTVVVSVINTTANECKGYMEQERFPFQITHILSYYLKEADLLVFLLLDFCTVFLHSTPLSTVIMHLWSASLYSKHFSSTRLTWGPRFIKCHLHDDLGLHLVDYWKTEFSGFPYLQL